MSLDVDKRPAALDRLGAQLDRAAAEGLDSRRVPGPRSVLVVAIAAVVLAGFSVFTAPGRAAIDWVGDLVAIGEADLNSPGGLSEATLVGEGQTPDGQPFYLKAAWDKGEVCAFLELEAESDWSGEFGSGYCGYQDWREEVIDRVGFSEAENGGVVAYGLADPDVADVVVTGPDGARPPTQVFPISGEVERDDGSKLSVSPVTAWVSFMPPGTGDIEQGNAAEVEVFSADGVSLANSELSWARLSIGRGDDSLGNFYWPCAPIPFRDEICRDAVSGEIRRVDASLAQPLVPELEGALTAKGYEFVPATDDDREEAEDFWTLDDAESIIQGSRGLQYLTLGRLTGPGFENRLVYLFHHFNVEYHDGQSGGTTDAYSIENPPSALDPTARTYIFNALTLERIAEIDPG